MSAIEINKGIKLMSGKTLNLLMPDFSGTMLSYSVALESIVPER